MKPKKEIHDTRPGTLEEKLTIGKGVHYIAPPKLLEDYTQEMMRSMWKSLPREGGNIPNIDYEVFAMKMMLDDLAKEIHKLKQK